MYSHLKKHCNNEQEHFHIRACYANLESKMPVLCALKCTLLIPRQLFISLVCSELPVLFCFAYIAFLSGDFCLCPLSYGCLNRDGNLLVWLRGCCCCWLLYASLPTIRRKWFRLLFKRWLCQCIFSYIHIFIFYTTDFFPFFLRSLLCSVFFCGSF